jgi:type VI secretion system protein ImpC
MNREPTPTVRGTTVEMTLGVELDRVVAAAPRPDDPFCIVLLGDFRGRGERADEGAPALGDRKPLRIDRDNFDDVLAQLAPAVTLGLSEEGPRITIRFSELEDFHPDRLYTKLPLFRSMRGLRQRLADTATFREAARELWGPPDAGTEESPPAASPRSGANVLADILGGPLDEAPAPVPARDQLADYIRRIVAPHAVPDADPRQPEALAQIDTAISDQMRAVLHHPDFRALEALWRSVFLLVRRVETDSQLRIYLLDVARSELADDIVPERELQETSLHRLLVEPSVGVVDGTPWSLLIGNFAFGPRPDDVRLLRRLGRLASLAGAPWIAAADPALIGCPSFGETPDADDWGAGGSVEWNELRQSPEATSIGLVLPRFLLRLPYGEDTEPCDEFDFEEAGSRPGHETYLWGNPATACALLLAQSFSAAGWALRPGMTTEIGSLPLHLVRAEGETVAKPCAEAWMTERGATRILDCGVMPLASIRDRDAVKLLRFQSVASPAAPLAGRWNAARTA